MGTLQWNVHSPKLVVTLPFSHRWHTAVAPSNGTTSTPVGRHPPPQPQHTTMAPYDGTTSTPLKLVVTLHPNHSTLQWQPTMAPAQSAKVVRRPPPFLEVRTPIAIAIWGKSVSPKYQDQLPSGVMGPL